MYELETVVKRLKTNSEHDAVVADTASAGAAERPSWLRIADPDVDAPAEKAAPQASPEKIASRPVPVAALADDLPQSRTDKMEDEDVTHDDVSDPAPKRERMGPVFTVVGAAAAIALIVGMGIWTYNLGQRDALEVPIVRAMTSPARVPPERPGGLTTPHQGLAVNRVLEGGGVRPVAPTVVTAPGNETLTAEDATRPVLRQQEQSVAPEPRIVMAPAAENGAPTIASETAPVEAALAPPTARNTASAATETIDVAALPATTGTASVPQTEGTSAADRMIDEAPVVPVQEARVAPETTTPGLPAQPEADLPAVVQPAAQPQQAAPTEVTLTAAERAVPPLGQGSTYAPAVISLTKPRPARLITAAATQDVDAAVSAAVNAAVAAAAEPAQPAPVETQTASGFLDTIPLPKGTRMIQLGAYDSPDIARREWSRFERQHTDLLGERQTFIQRTDSSGRTFYRLRVAGYDSGADTRAACAALTGRGLPCITVTLR